MQLTVCQDIDSLQETLAGLALDGKRVALVPTMGALHEGHLALVRQAKELADAVVVSIFVNPKQFSANEDLSKYPRPLSDDLKRLDEVGADVAYTPSVADIYPSGFSTTISVGAMGQIMCGRFRPGHFDGVATVVAKLFLRMLPHVAVFGEKDYQQLCVIQQLVNDLDIAVEIAGVETVREPDGLALSSRNVYLSPEQRALAPKLYHTMEHAGAHLISGAPAATVLAQAAEVLARDGFRVEYLELRHSETLEELASFAPPCRLFAAAWLGTTRLIDNIELG